MIAGLHCTDGDWYWHEGYGSRCARKGCTNKDHDVVTHWQLSVDGVFLFDTARPDQVPWLESIVAKLNEPS